MRVNMLIAGFGGQGVLFAGKVIAYTAMIDNREVSWLPSYGPEMRGGTANCSVCIDDEPIGSPIVLEPELFVAMNQPSFDKFIEQVEPGGTIIYDSSLIEDTIKRTDVSVHAVPATRLATERGFDTLTNLIMLGQTLRHVPFTSYQTLSAALEKCVPASKAHLLEPNLKALKTGFEYQAGDE